MMLIEFRLVLRSPMDGHFYYLYVFVAIVIVGANAAKTNKRC